MHLNHMKWFVSIILLLSFVLQACSSEEESDRSIKSKAAILDENWATITDQARDQTVNVFMWGGSDTINRYMDSFVAPRLKEQTGVILNRVPVTDTKDILNKLRTEKQAGSSDGTVDVMWINGENFKIAKEENLLLGSFLSKLPNATSYLDLESPEMAFDFGLATDGMEAPWGKAQFVMIYDSAKIANPPKSYEALFQWIKENPGKFTYPAPPDFTGSAWIRNALYELNGGYQPFIGDPEAAELDRKLTGLWQRLNEIEPYLWREGKTYPENIAKLDQLFVGGEVWMSMSYDPAKASNLIKNGTFPSTVRTFVFDAGTLANTHYLAIPYNSPSPAAAMAAINYLISPEAQIAKSDPKYWGEEPILDPSKLSADDLQKLRAIDRGPATLPSDELASKQLPEMKAQYVEQIEKGWQDNVAKK